MIRRALIVAVTLLLLAAGTMLVLGPSRFQAVSLGLVRPSQGLPPIPSSGQGVFGYASIGPVSPLCSSSNIPASPTTQSVQLGIRNMPGGDWAYHQIAWNQDATCNFALVDSDKIAPGPAVIGTFRVNLLAGSYQLTLSLCNSTVAQMGCRTLPASVTVSAGHYSRVDLAFDTGIR